VPVNGARGSFSSFPSLGRYRRVRTPITGREGAGPRESRFTLHSFTESHTSGAEAGTLWNVLRRDQRCPFWTTPSEWRPWSSPMTGDGKSFQPHGRPWPTPGCCAKEQEKKLKSDLRAPF
ncbi:hypothetical protein C0J52_18480, partial [Blattella germanica]